MTKNQKWMIHLAATYPYEDEVQWRDLMDAWLDENPYGK